MSLRSIRPSPLTSSSAKPDATFRLRKSDSTRVPSRSCSLRLSTFARTRRIFCWCRIGALGGRLRSGLAALAAGGLLLGRGAALPGVPARPRLLPAVGGRLGRVGDLGCPLLGHPLILQRLVLLLV